MIHANEIRKGNAQIEFSIAALEGPRLVPIRKNLNSEPATDQQPSTAFAVHISGIQLIVAMALGICSVFLLTWAFVRHWLFAP
jgi:hypothetical protein